MAGLRASSMFIVMKKDLPPAGLVNGEIIPEPMLVDKEILDFLLSFGFIVFLFGQLEATLEYPPETHLKVGG